MKGGGGGPSLFYSQWSVYIIYAMRGLISSKRAIFVFFNKFVYFQIFFLIYFLDGGYFVSCRGHVVKGEGINTVRVPFYMQ